MKFSTLKAFNAPQQQRKTPADYKPGSWFKIRAAAEGSSDPVEILIYQEIGKDWWTGEGVEAKAFAEELKKIPKDKEIKVRINSPGGSVWDGLTIHNLLAERRDKVECIVDGVAASIASVIALAGRSLKMPRNTLFMIHDPWGFAQGNADDMRDAAKMLDAHRDAIVTVYETKTGASADEIKKWMKDESWYTSDQAKEAGFADEILDAVSFNASPACLKFSKIPQALKTTIKSGPKSMPMESSSESVESADTDEAGSSESSENPENTTQISAASGGQRKEQNIMNRAQIIAMLKKHGVKVDDNATDEQLLARLNEVLAQRSGNDNQDKADDAPADDAADGAPAPAKPKSKKKGSAPADAADSDDVTFMDFRALQDNMTRVNAQLEGERKQRITSVVQQCIDEDRIPAAQGPKWIERALKDETVLADLQAMAPKPPGAEPVRAVLGGESQRDIERGLLELRKPMDSYMRGNSVSPQAIRDASVQTSQIIAAHRKKLAEPLAANTIDSALKRTVILNDLMREFKRKLLLISVFSTKFESVPLEGTNKVAVPFYSLDTTASKDFSSATGYTFSGNTDVGSREVNINKRKYQDMDFSSDTFRRAPYFRPEVQMQLKAEQLAVDVWTDILSIVKADPYGVTVFNAEPGTFDSDDVATLKGVVEKADWPSVGRALVLSTDHETALGQDDYVKSALHSGSTQTLREGSIGRLYGFDLYFSPRIPTNSEDLSGFLCLPQAALVATAPIMPAPGVRQKLLRYDIVTDPDTGITFEYRYGADEWADRDREVVECNYGYTKGNASALKRITSGAAEMSSSSSASSVNSSSSSSSSPSY